MGAFVVYCWQCEGKEEIEMGVFDGILICTDLDGTLLGSDRRVSKENREAIEYFKREGGLFTFVTGRPASCVKEIYSAARPNAPFGCFNGGGLYDGEAKRYVWMREIARDVLEQVEYVAEHVPGIGVQINTFENIYFYRENTSMEWFREITGVPKLPVGCVWDVNEPLAKIVFGDRDTSHIERTMELLAAHPLAGEFDYVRSEETLCEILPKGSNKGEVLPRLAEHVGIPMSHVLAMGDYYNDLEMIRAAGVGIAMGNAMPEVKAVADVVTVTNDEHAVARVIEDIEAGRISL